MKQSFIFILFYFFFLYYLYPLLKCRWAKNDGIIFFVWTIPNFVLLLFILLVANFCFGRLRCCRASRLQPFWSAKRSFMIIYLFLQGKTEGTSPGLNERLCPVRLDLKSVAGQEVLGIAKLISYRGKVGISLFHTDFPRFPSLIIWRKLVER